MPGRIYSRKRSNRNRRSFPRKRSCPYNRTRSRSRRRRTRRRKSTRGGGKRWDSFKRAITPTKVWEYKRDKGTLPDYVTPEQVQEMRGRVDERKQTAREVAGTVARGIGDAALGVGVGLMALGSGKRKSRSRTPRRRSRSRRGGSAACPKGKIRRKSYIRKSRGRKSRRRSTRVKSACVPDKGKRGKTPKSKRVLPKLTPGKLGKYGYRDVKHTPAATRRHALEKAVKKEGYAPIVRRLNVIRTYNKNNQNLYKVYDSDMKWMQRSLKPKYAKSA